ncbi:MAG: hypothetical protein HY704_14445 [Gemmatimonadetes bacterium]|nr:hypothetical protein [Gemmatimonadota bacterium]
MTIPRRAARRAVTPGQTPVSPRPTQRRLDPARTVPRRRLSQLSLATLLFTSLAACDVPTDIPDWNQTWVVAGDSTSMGVADLLPSSVTVSADKAAFVLSLQSVTFRRSLGQMCDECAAANGLTVPKPAFTATIEDRVQLPADVVSANVTVGTVEVRVGHNFEFDPLRPSATARGGVAMRLLHGGATIASLTISGETQAFPPNTAITRTLTVPATTVTGPITVQVSIESPEGDPVRIDTADELTVTGVPQSIRVSQATVRVANKTVDVDPIDLDLEDVDQTLVDRVKGGAFLVDITNQFEVSGTLSVRVQPQGAATITKSLSVTPGSSSRRIEFSGSELRTILGRRSTMTASGGVSATGGSLTVRPAQILVVKSKIELTIGLKEG